MINHIFYQTIRSITTTKYQTMVTSAALLPFLIFLSTTSVSLVKGQNTDGIYLDRFTYGDEDVVIKNDLNNDGNSDHTSVDYSPRNWRDIRCNEGSRLDECVGYTDKWTTGREWGITKNYCKWCPEGENNNCGRHHQSPVNLQRAVGLDFDWSSEFYSELANECIVSIEFQFNK